MRDWLKRADWLDKIPTWLKATFGLIAAIATFLIAFRENWRLYTTIAVVLILGYILVLSLYITLARQKSRSRQNQSKYRYGKYRLFGLIGVAAVFWGLMSLIAFEPTRQFALDGILGTQTPSPTSTLIPTSTHLPTPQLGSADVLITEFDSRHATRTLDVAHRLEANLEEVLRSSGIDDVDVQVTARPVASEVEAQMAANETGSKVIIWGWYDDEGIQVRVFLSGGGQPGRELSGTDEIPLVTSAEPASGLSFVVRDILPENVSFLSLFVIGHLKYVSNDYEAGYQAFDAAMNNLPGTVFIENEAILHFFRGRQMGAAGAELSDVLCEYAKAVKSDPNFAEPYNNLGTIIGRLYLENTLASPIPSQARVCLSEAGLSSEQDLYPPELYERALKINPGLTAAEYNLYAFQWKNKQSGLDPSIFEEIQKKDPSIAGTYIILGIELERHMDYAEAIRMYESGTQADPANTFLHLNLGSLYIRQENNESKAEKEFRTVLSIDSDHREARLALANLLYGQGKFDEASQQLNVVLDAIELKPDQPSRLRDSVDWDARVLRSAILFHQNKTAQAIQELESIVQVTRENSFERFMLGLFYQNAGRDMEAIESFRAADPLQGGGNQTSQFTWIEILSRCDWEPANNTFEDWAMQELPDNDCLPHDESQRMNEIFDMFHNNVFYRTFRFPLFQEISGPLP